MIAVAVPNQRTGTGESGDRLRFVAPLPGLGDLREFTLTALDSTGLLFALRAVDDPDVRLFLVPPQPFFADYAPALDADTLADLGVDDDEAVVLAVVTPARGGEGPTANLLAPVVVNPRTGAAKQVLLDGSAWPLRAPLAVA